MPQIKSLLFLLFLQLFCLTTSNAQTSFERLITKGFDFDETWITETFDSSYVISGSRSILDTGAHAYLVKADKNGNIIWTRSFGDTVGAVGYNVIETFDHNLMLCMRYGLLSSQHTTRFTKMDPNGHIIQSTSVGMDSTHALTGYLIRQTMDSGFIVLSWYDGPALMKLDKYMNVSWFRYFPRQLSINNEIADVKQTFDGGYILTGYAGYYNNIELIKTDNTGEVQWSKLYHLINNEKGFSVSQLPDSGYIVCGSILEYGDGCGVLIRTDDTGKIIWCKRYIMEFSFGQETFNYAAPTPDGGFICTGFTPSEVVSADALIVKTDASGQVQWTRALRDYRANQTGRYIAPASGGGYVMAADHDYRCNFVKLDSAGRSCHTIDTVVQAFDRSATTVNFPLQTLPVGQLLSWTHDSISTVSVVTEDGCIDPNTINNPPIITVSPNPGNGILQFSGPLTGTLTIYNSQVNVILQQWFQGSAYIDVSGFSPGVYFYTLVGAGQNNTSGMFIVQ